MADRNVKQSPVPVVPRTMKIVNEDGTITRSGQLLLEQLQPSVVMFGYHGDKPNAEDVPDGALWIDSDRSVIYQSQSGEWHYIAGTMYGTLSPDERPADLGPNDAGFQFRSTDTDPALAPRFGIWSGTIWVEATLIMYGGHGTRPPADAATPPRTIYVESDRSGVIYQQQGNAWHFLAGTMWGTLSPDTRPTDLGVNDAGFAFRSTDPPPREYIWSGTVWVNVSVVAGAVAGAGNLTTIGALPKVSSAGTLNESALLDNGTVVRLSRTISGTVQPTLEIDSGITVKGRVGRVNNTGRLDLSVNLSYDGANFSLDDTAQAATRITLAPAAITFQDAAAGGIPAAVGNRVQINAAGITVTGNANVTGVYQVGGLQVVGPRGAVLTASGSAVGAAPAAYTQVYEQTLATAINNLITRVGQLEARLQAHGLIS